jgi:aspartyl-tRNA(Asn)/glutamyl-tRNA(Gln) amidotransferase subunit C
MGDIKKKISVKEIENLGFLTRISLSETEIESFTCELNEIVDYISSISNVCTETASVLPQTEIRESVIRKDIVEQSMPRQDILSNAPDKTDKFLKVPKIL